MQFKTEKLPNGLTLYFERRRVYGRVLNYPACQPATDALKFLGHRVLRPDLEEAFKALGFSIVYIDQDSTKRK
jgi:hypothetical protein